MDEQEPLVVDVRNWKLTDEEILAIPEDPVIHRIGLEREGWDIPPEAA